MSLTNEPIQSKKIIFKGIIMLSQQEVLTQACYGSFYTTFHHHVC